MAIVSFRTASSPVFFDKWHLGQDDVSMSMCEALRLALPG